MYRSSVALVAFCAGLPGVSLAQEGPSEFALEEIVVTAQRRVEDLQRTPIAITAIGEQAIQTQAKTTLAEVLNETPSVQVQGNAAGGQVYIRGVGSNNDPVYGNPAVNLNIDGVYQQNPAAVLSGLYDIERVEVLRGPQGTLYGRNATAGSINVITANPDASFGGAGSLQVGNYDELRVKGMLNVPVSDQLATRLAVQSTKRDGYLSNGDSDEENWSARLKMLYSPSDSVRLLLAGSYLDEDGSPGGSVAAPLSSHGDPWYTTYLQGVLRGQTKTFYSQLDWTTSVGTLTVLPAHQQADRLSNRQLLGNVTSFDTEEEQNSLEVRLASTPDSAYTWVVGLYALDLDQSRVQGPNYIGGTLQPVEDVTSRTKTVAGFGQLTVPLSDEFRLTLGGRFNTEDKDQRYADADVHTKSDDSFTYKAGFEADVREQSMLYGGVSTGWKAGGFGENPLSSQYEPEEITSYQLGLKNRFLDDRLQVNAEAFLYDYTNYQVSYPLIIDGVFYVVTRNAGEATVKGLEVEAEYAVTQAGRIRVSGAYTLARFDRFSFTDIAGTKVYDGADLPNAPRASGDLGYEHRFELGNAGTITAYANIHFSSKYWATVDRTLDSLQPSYTRSDVTLSYTAPQERWAVQAYIRNIEDEPVRVLGLANPTTSRLMLGEPRTYGLVMSAKF